MGEVTEGEPEFAEPDVDLSAWDDAEAWNLPGMDEPEVEALVRFRFPRSLWAERNDMGELVASPCAAPPPSCAGSWGSWTTRRSWHPPSSWTSPGDSGSA